MNRDLSLSTVQGLMQGLPAGIKAIAERKAGAATCAYSHNLVHTIALIAIRLG